MDAKIDKIKRLLDTNLEKYPNITSVWTKYLDQQIALLEKSLEKVNVVFTSISEDLPLESIALLYLLSKSQVT